MMIICLVLNESRKFFGIFAYKAVKSANYRPQVDLISQTLILIAKNISTSVFVFSSTNLLSVRSRWT